MHPWRAMRYQSAHPCRSICGRHTQSVDNVAAQESSSTKNGGSVTCKLIEHKIAMVRRVSRVMYLQETTCGKKDVSYNRAHNHPLASTYRPPWILMIGFPVRVIATSWRYLRCNWDCTRALVGAGASALEAPLMARDFCMVALRVDDC